MIWRSFITFREYVRVRKIYLDNQLPKCGDFMEIHFQIKFQKNRFDKELLCLDHYLLSDKVSSLLKYINFIGIKKF